MSTNMINLPVSDVLSRAWELTKKHGLLLAVTLFVWNMITSSISSIGFPYAEYMEAISQNDVEAMQAILMQSSSGSYWVMLLSFVFNIGFLNMLLHVVKGTDSSLSFSRFKLSLSNYLYGFLIHLIYSAIVVAGLLLCLLPGIYLAIRLQFALLHKLNNPETGVVDAFKYSWQITSNHAWDLFLLGLAGLLIAWVGLLICCVGVYFTSMVFVFASVVAYLILSGHYLDQTTEEVTA